jgi:hypothetical protein
MKVTHNRQKLEASQTDQTEDRQEYINKVADRLKMLLSIETRLPCKFVISGGWTTLSDAPITINLKPEKPVAGVFDGMDLFSDIQRRLNEEFSANHWYFGIHIGVPHQFLGQLHLDLVEKQKREQARDNQLYRKVRLKDEKNG